MHHGYGQKREPFGFVASMIKFLQSVYYASIINKKKTLKILLNKMHTCFDLQNNNYFIYSIIKVIIQPYPPQHFFFLGGGEGGLV